MPDTLIARGGRTIPDLVFKTWYYGPFWTNSAPGNPHPPARRNIDDALGRAMADPTLNAILAEYCGGAPVTATMLPSDIVPADPHDTTPGGAFNEHSIRRVLQRLLTDQVADLDLTRTAINIVLPQRMTVAVLGLDAQQRRQAGLATEPGVPRDDPNAAMNLAGYHGSMSFPGAFGTARRDPTEVLYSVVVWSDGPIGIPVPGWQPWESITATIFHELAEIRTNPDVDIAIRTGQAKWIGWNTDPLPGPDDPDCREIADIALIHQELAPDAFCKFPVASGDPVPIQRLWSNRRNGLLPAR